MTGAHVGPLVGVRGRLRGARVGELRGEKVSFPHRVDPSGRELRGTRVGRGGLFHGVEPTGSVGERVLGGAQLLSEEGALCLSGEDGVAGGRAPIGELAGVCAASAARVRARGVLGLDDPVIGGRGGAGLIGHWGLGSTKAGLGGGKRGEYLR